MTISTKTILQILHILSWIIFVGISIDAGGFISNTIYTLAINSGHAQNFWGRLDLSGLYKYDPGYFLMETSLMSLVAIMKATIFYLIIRILINNKLDMSQPFSKEVGRLIFLIAYLALFISFFSQMGVKYAEWFVKQGVKMPDIQNLRMSGADVWLFMSVTLFVIGHIFKRGIEIQTENELTV